MTRRNALSIVAAFLTRGQAQPLPKNSPCRLPETLVLDFGAGACTVKQIQVKQGAYTATIATSELLTALGAKVGND